MTASTGPAAPANVTRLARHVHARLMPDYNRAATVYWWCAVLLGTAALVWALLDLAARPPQVWLQVAAGAAIAMLAGFFPVRIPNSRNSFAAGEVFIFLLLLMHGPAAAMVAAAGEVAVGAYRTSRRWTSRLASPAMAALSLLITGSALHAALNALQARGWGDAGLVIVAAVVFAVAAFTLNTLLVTMVARLKAGRGLDLSDLFSVWGWVGIAYAGSAAVAGLLWLTYLQSGLSVLAAMVPLLATLLAALHYFFRQQEAAESARRAGEEAAAREAELAQRHVIELQASERRFHSAFTHASIGMALLALDGRILQANAALRTLLQRRDADLLQHEFLDFVWPEDRAGLRRQFERSDGESAVLELRCVRRDGQALWVSTHCSAFSEPGSQAPCMILQLQDVHARREAEAGLQRIAFEDVLTGLPNRRRFQELLAQAVDRAQREAEAGFAVMFLDFDRFKLINDSLGHHTGDAFLVQVAQRIQGELRPQDTLARLGGDEFAILVHELGHERDAVRLAERLGEALRRPFDVAGHELSTSASIGITFSAFGYTSPEDMLRDADTAMYKAKGAGKARYALFDTSLHQDVARRLRLEGELRHAIEGRALQVLFQPLYELGSGRVAGFEALVRWDHPQEGRIAPLDFLPIAEEAGLMLPLTDFVLHCACRQLAAWQAAAAPGAPLLTMNVNVSAHDIAHAPFVARVSRALVESGLQPAQLCLELTENILMSRLEGALPVLADLRRLGVQLAIDDFGTGYSSLSHLSTLPIDSLKIDRSFVAQLAAGRNDAAVVRSIIALGQSLGKKVVAEGIETGEQCRMLAEMGCRFGQGYHLGRPLEAAQAGGLLSRAETPDRSPAATVDLHPAAVLLH
jgi:diguanylate cyclase (GGDEF)-like protein/PAS domain S-box-containing protein